MASTQNPDSDTPDAHVYQDDTDTELDEILQGLHWLPIQDRYPEPHPVYPGDVGLNDEHIVKAKTALLAWHHSALLREVLPLLEDESVASLNYHGDSFKAGTARNELRAELRQQLLGRYGEGA